jgi:hypothetical protein
MHTSLTCTAYLACLVCSLACSHLFAQEKVSTSPSKPSAVTDEVVIPPARTKYMGRTIAQTMSFHGAPWLVRDNREEEERPSAEAGC